MMQYLMLYIILLMLREIENESPDLDDLLSLPVMSFDDEIALDMDLDRLIAQLEVDLEDAVVSLPDVEVHIDEGLFVI